MATSVALAAKRVQINMRCPWCMVTDEDIGHVLFGCSFARDVWIKVGIQEVSSVVYQASAWEIFSGLFSTCTKEKLTWIAMGCWSLWNSRNRWVWDKVVGSDSGVQLAESNLLHEWKQGQI